MKRPTREQIANVKDWDSFLVSVNEECILCWYKEYWGILIVKLPEMVSQCPDCAEKYPDTKNKYCWVLYKIGYDFIEEDEIDK